MASDTDAWRGKRYLETGNHHRLGLRSFYGGGGGVENNILMD